MTNFIAFVYAYLQSIDGGSAEFVKYAPFPEFTPGVRVTSRLSDRTGVVVERDGLGVIWLADGETEPVRATPRALGVIR